MLDIQTLNIIRERNTGEILLFIVLAQGDNKPSEIKFFHGQDLSKNVSMMN